MMSRSEFIKQIQCKATLVAVTKNRSIEQVESLFKDGVTIFGENKVQELLSKYEPDQPWEWHFVGHLQTNKVSKVVSICSMVHSVDSMRLLDEIHKQAKKQNKVIDVLIQVNTLNEKGKFGCNIDEVDSLVQTCLASDQIRFRGFMVMGPTNQTESETIQAFCMGKQLFDHYKKNHPTVDTLSMGMSGDYETALKHGSTMLRLGSILF